MITAVFTMADWQSRICSGSIKWCHFSRLELRVGVTHISRENNYLMLNVSEINETET